MKLLIVFLLCGASEAFLSLGPNGRPRITASVSQQTRGGFVTLTCHRPADDGTPDCDDFTWTKVEGNLPSLPNSQSFQFTMDSLHQGFYTCQCSNTWGSSEYSLQVFIRLLADTTTTTTTTTPAPINCGSPVIMANGRTERVTSTTTGGLATYLCNTGYTMLGSATVICLGNGQWSILPTCVPDCGDPGVVENAHRSQVTSTTSGGAVTYYCDAGFVVQGTSITSVTSVCQTSGQWTSLPTCVRGQESNGPEGCGSPGSLANGRTIQVTSTTTGGVATYACNTGYTILGSAAVTCLGNGQWTTLPTCVPDGPKGQPTVVTTTKVQYTNELVNLTCHLPDADCATYTWNRLEGAIDSPPSTHVYTFTMDASHEGNYSCRCINHQGSSEWSEPVQVTSRGERTLKISVLKPTIVASINEQYNGDDVTLTCTIPDDNNNNNNAAPCSNYRWTRLEGNLNYLPNTATYKFTMDTRHQGNYTCQCDDQDAVSMTSDPVKVSSLGARPAEVSKVPGHGGEDKSFFDNVAVIAGIAVGGFVIVALVTTAIIVCRKYRFNLQPRKTSSDKTGADNMGMEARQSDGGGEEPGALGNAGGDYLEPSQKQVNPYQHLNDVIRGGEGGNGDEYQELDDVIPSVVIDRGYMNPVHIRPATYYEIM